MLIEGVPIRIQKMAHGIKKKKGSKDQIRSLLPDTNEMLAGAVVPPPVYQCRAGQSPLAKSIDVQQSEIWRRIEHKSFTFVIGKKDFPSNNNWRGRKAFPHRPSQTQLTDEFTGFGVMT